tara:strand:- start:59 stop:304 length:246 start_codon:yes stop_codon:yes gene_type:complete
MNESKEEPRRTAPNWTPTGNGGQWLWDENGETDSRTKKNRPCWRWYDEVYGWGWKAHSSFKETSSHVVKEKKSWVKRMLGL